MRYTAKVQAAVLVASTITLSALIQPSKAGNLMFDADGNLMNSTGDVVRVTVDSTGNVVDTTGNVIRVTNDTTGLLVDPTTGIIRGMMDTSGNLVDAGGHTFVSTTDSPLVAVDRTNGTIIGTVDSTGHMIRSGGSRTSRVLLVRRDQASTSSEGLLIDPVSGIVRGTVDSSGKTMDPEGHSASARTFGGLLVIDPMTKIVKGSIDHDGRLINLDLGVINNALILAKKPSNYIIDPITGQVKGFIDASGNWFDVTGSTMPSAPDTVYTVVDPTTRILKGYIDRNGQLISSDLQIPEQYRHTTVTTSNENGKTTTTTTITSSASSPNQTLKFVLPTRGTFMAINPLTGEVKGSIDPATGQINGIPVPSGYLVVDKSTGTVIAAVNPTGSFVVVRSLPLNDTFAASIDSQRVELGRMITSSELTGQMSTDQATRLQAMLDKIPSSVELNRLSYFDALPVIDILRSVRGQLVATAHIQPATPIIGWGLVTVDREMRWVDDITFRRLQLTRRIGDEFAYGHISSEQTAKLKSEIDRVAALENTYRLHGNGTFTNQQSRTLYVDYDRIASDLDHYIAMRKRGTIGTR